MDVAQQAELLRLCEWVDRLTHECPQVAGLLIARGRWTHSRLWCRESAWERVSRELQTAARSLLRQVRRIKRRDVSLKILQIEDRSLQTRKTCRRCHRFNYDRYRHKLPFLCRLASPEPQWSGWRLDEHGQIHNG